MPLHFVQPSNIYGLLIFISTALRDRIPAVRATFESRMFRPDGCELLFVPSLVSNETCFDVGTLLRCLGMLHKTGAPFKHLLYLSE